MLPLLLGGFPTVPAQALSKDGKSICDFGMTLPDYAGKSGRRLETALEIGTVAVLGKKRSKISLAGRNTQ
jgi:hypothetical protein